MDKRDEHPEDRASRLESIAYAKDRGSAFCAWYRDRIDSLITRYADADAEAALGELRELFWTRSWEEKGDR